MASQTVTLFTSMRTAVRNALRRCEDHTRQVQLDMLMRTIAAIETRLIGASPTNADRVYAALLNMCDDLEVFAEVVK